MIGSLMRCVSVMVLLTDGTVRTDGFGLLHA
jgi:hypothetical protein